MRELTSEDLDVVSGSGWFVTGAYCLGAVAVTYKTAYETATFFGLGKFGSYLGLSLADYHFRLSQNPHSGGKMGRNR